MYALTHLCTQLHVHAQVRTHIHPCIHTHTHTTHMHAHAQVRIHMNARDCRWLSLSIASCIIFEVGSSIKLELTGLLGQPVRPRDLSTSGYPALGLQIHPVTPGYLFIYLFIYLCMCKYNTPIDTPRCTCRDHTTFGNCLPFSLVAAGSLVSVRQHSLG